MSKPTVARTALSAQAKAPRQLRDWQPDLEIALSKARAAAILLKADSADYLQIPVFLRAGESEKDIRAWISGFAHDALDSALEEAEAARRQIQGAPKFGAA